MRIKLLLEYTTGSFTPGAKDISRHATDIQKILSRIVVDLVCGSRYNMGGGIFRRFRWFSLES